MDKRLERAKAAMKARNTSFPVLVLDGSMAENPETFSATVYGADYQPVPGLSDLTSAQVKSGNHFMLRMRTRAEFEAEKAKTNT